ncbi:MAG: phenylalanine--tRNA ligase subunit beta [Clostridiales bacterium]|nr:phenylalanine--tRNA ligase subunit beta [Candidatus Crickella merdequi]
MNISLNFVKKFVDLPEELTPAQIAFDLTMRTVEVEDVINTAEKFENIVVGEIKEVNAHPNADQLKCCIVDCGEDELKQIVCGGSNLYAGEKVVISKPGAYVYWHGNNELVLIKESKLRGEPSYGMICGASEVYMEGLFPPKDETEIVDLSDVDCYVGQNIAEVIGMDDIILEVDNKSLTNRPDLWGHYGVAREIAAIYELPLKPLPELNVEGLPEYKVTVHDPERCPRYTALEIENVYEKEAPLWMKALIINGGMRPINAIVDITNYVMMAVGQPEHAFDRNHVEGAHINVRTAKKDETLTLLDRSELELTEDDLVICDTVDPMGLAGIKGGIKDSILPETTAVVLEVADFTAAGIRRTEKRQNEKTDASMRYEKGVDTQRAEQGMALSMTLFKEIFPECEFVSYADVHDIPTERSVIDVTQAFLDQRLGKVIPEETIEGILTRLGFEVSFDGAVWHCIAPTWRSTGDVHVKDDVLGEIARLLSFESFEPTPLHVDFEHSVNQPQFSLQRRIKEYLAFRCGFYEIFTYPWVDEKYLKAAGTDFSKAVRLAEGPSPETSTLRTSLIPGQLESVEKNLRYFDSFSIFETAQCFEKGEYHPSNEIETLPIHKNLISGTITGKDAKTIFFQVKGVIENMASYCHCKELTFAQKEKPSWADSKVWLNVICDKEIAGSIGLISVSAMNEAGIKRTNVAAFELDYDKIPALPSRDNEFKHLPTYPLVQQDLSLIVDESMTWAQIKESIKFQVKDIWFVEEYRGEQIPEGKKSIMFSIKIGNDDSTMTSKQIEKKMAGIMKNLKTKCGAELRD